MDNYQSILTSIKAGDILLTWDMSNSLMSLPIKIGNYFKLGPKSYKDRGWTHSAVYIGNGQIVEALLDGIVRRDLKEAYLNGKFGLKVKRHKNARDEDIKKAIDFYINEPGVKYDKKGLAYFLLANFVPPQFNFLIDDDYVGKWFNVENAYFCSELVSEGFKRGNIYCFERQPYKVMPIEFDNELLFDNVYEYYLPKKENKTLYGIKAFIFNLFYLIAAVLFPIILIALLLLILSLFVIIVVGIIFLSQKIKNQTQRKNDKDIK